MKNSTGPSLPGRNPSDERVRLELLRTALGYVPMASVGSIVAIVFLISWYWETFSGWLGLSWLFGAIVVNVGLLAIWRGWHDLSPTQQTARREAFLFARAIASMLWVAGVFIVHSIGPPDQLWMLIAVWAGLAISSVPAQGALPVAVYWFLFPPALAIIVVMMMIGTAKTMLVAVAAGVFAMVVFFITRRHHAMLTQGIRATLSDDESQKTIATQAVELRRLLDERNKLQSMKDQFVAAASHDLRQPAQAIGLLARSIHQSVPTIALKAKTSALMHASDQINDLLNSLLDTARLDMTHEQAEPCWVSVADLLTRLEPSLQVKAGTHNVELVLSKAAYAVYSDPLFLERILQNLLTNAIEHSQGNRVTVDYDLIEDESQEQVDDVLQLLIVDNGIGLDAAAVAVIEQASVDGPAQPQRSFSVHGMGLLISARLARLAGHRLTVETQRDSGTEFRLEFNRWHFGKENSPVAQSPARSDIQALGGSADDTVPELNLESAQILIVEDNALVRIGLGAVAQGAGFDATVVDGVDAALEAIHERGILPKAILADWHLGDGITAADIIPELQAALPAPIPVVVLTGELALGWTEQELSVHFNNVATRLLIKPIDTESLQRALLDILSARPPARSATLDAGASAHANLQFEVAPIAPDTQSDAQMHARQAASVRVAANRVGGG